jgi:hypothetical protein
MEYKRRGSELSYARSEAVPGRYVEQNQTSLGALLRTGSARQIAITLLIVCHRIAQGVE